MKNLANAGWKLIFCILMLVVVILMYNHIHCSGFQFVSKELKDAGVSECIIEVRCSENITLVLFSTATEKVGSALVSRNIFGWDLLSFETNGPNGEYDAMEMGHELVVIPKQITGMSDLKKNLSFWSGYIDGNVSGKVQIKGKDARVLYFPEMDFSFCYIIEP